MSKLKVKSWTTDEAKDILKRRLELVKKNREENFEAGWKANESSLFASNAANQLTPSVSGNSLAEIFQASAGSKTSSIHIPRVMQNLRFLHSQMSANPPSVIPRATSNELTDRRATEAADDIIQYGREQYNLQEYMDLTSLSTLTYGSGFVKPYHDPDAGKVMTFDESSDEIQMHGDFKCRPILIWDIWFDRDATVWEDVNYTFERKLIPFPTAVSKWPEHEELLMSTLVDNTDHPSRINSIKSTSGSATSSGAGDDPRNMLVEVYEYTERGLPENGMAGRRCFMVEEGTVLGKMTKNPHPGAIIPYGILTDIDVPGEIYGKTTVDFAIMLANVVDSLDNMTLNNIELHGSVKLVIFDGAEVNADDFSDDPVDIISVNGTHSHAPYHLKPASISSDVYNLRQQMLEAMDGVMGVNELLQGKVSRELSGFASQTAINAANMVRHRLFNKYTAMVKFVFKTYLSSVVQNWKTERVLEVLGKENAPTIKYLSGADIASGYVLYVEYGTSFSLDPAMRREEILQSKDLQIEAGVSPKKILRSLRYNEIGDLFDAPEIAAKRQLEIFEEAIERFEKSGKVEVEQASLMRKAYHLEMAEAAMEFVMTRDFLQLDSSLREAIYEHMDAREQLAAETAAPDPNSQPGADPGAPGQPPGMTAVPGPAMPPVPDIGGVL